MDDTPIPTLGTTGTEKKRMGIVWIGFAMAAFFLTLFLGYFTYQYFQLTGNVNSTQPVKPSPQNLQKGKTSPGIHQNNPNSVKKDNRILFLRDPNPNKYDDLEAWLINPDGTNEVKTDLVGISSAFKHFGDSRVVYGKPSQTDKIYIHNLSTGVDIEYQPITHPDPKVDAGVYIPNLSYISPDYNYIVFAVNFTTDCNYPDIDSLEDRAVGFGPCEPDPLPGWSDGYYIVQISTRKFAFLAKAVSGLTWDLPGNTLYYNNEEFSRAGLDKINLSSFTKTRVENATSFGYVAYPVLSNKDLLVRADGDTGGELGKDSLSKITVVNKSSSLATIVAKGTWADIQPTISLSPKQDIFLYIRTRNFAGHQIYDLYKYTFSTNKSKQLTPSTNTLSYSSSGIWVDDDTFITLVDTIEEDNYKYTSVNNFLISINTTTGQITKLTQGKYVYGFYNR